MATIFEVARLAGVSKSTVSRVLNGGPVSDGARLRVQAAIRQLRFKPNAQARGLSLRRNHLVGVVVPEIGRLFYGAILEGISAALTELGFEMILCSTRNQKGRETALTKLLSSKRVDGLLLVTPREINWRPNDLPGELPVVVVDGESVRFSSFCADNFGGGYAAAGHLIRLGHRRIGVLAGLDTVECRQRLDGYRQALREHDCPYERELIRSGDYLFESGVRGMNELLALRQPPTAVFATSDLMAVGALKALQGRGLRVPEDMALIGFDDIEAAQWTTPTLSTVRQPLRQLGELGARKVARQIMGREPELTRTTLGCELVVRESCGAWLRPGNAACARV
ncbi:MAG: LacI family DNA-binding transcriptional regulator [Patescibacteria group bacterium]